MFLGSFIWTEELGTHGIEVLVCDVMPSNTSSHSFDTTNKIGHNPTFWGTILEIGW